VDFTSGIITDQILGIHFAGLDIETQDKSENMSRREVANQLF